MLYMKRMLEEFNVELDTNMTPDLEAEGYARNIARGIQALRKKTGLVKEDFIELVIRFIDQF